MKIQSCPDLLAWSAPPTYSKTFVTKSSVPEMLRREFIRGVPAAGLAASMPAALAAVDLPSLPTDSATSPFLFSVMLWTVERSLPFEQRINKVAEAGYHAVE